MDYIKSQRQCNNRAHLVSKGKSCLVCTNYMREVYYVKHGEYAASINTFANAVSADYAYRTMGIVSHGMAMDSAGS